MSRWAKRVLFFTTVLTITHGGFCAMRFNGTADYIDYKNSLVVQSSAVTVCAWINVTALPLAYAGIISRKASASAFESSFIKSTGKLAWYVNPPALNYDGTGTFTLSTGTWYHVAFTYDAINGGKGYVNGSVDGSFAASGSLGYVGSSFTVGVDTQTVSRFFNGYIDDPRVYRRALSQQEIKNLASCRCRYQNMDGLIFYSPMDEGAYGATSTAGSLVVDRSSNSISGTTSGNPVWFSGGILNYP